ncbi:hypothetical protein ONZ45_g13937 [Pleurotus djamor]|nr:hypothetical protein ONZ45_g13937 [Pleurotus djamor]
MCFSLMGRWKVGSDEEAVEENNPSKNDNADTAPPSEFAAELFDTQTTMPPDHIPNTNPRSNSCGESLCSLCSSLNIYQIFKHSIPEDKAIPLGRLPEILNRAQTCAFCRLIEGTFKRTWLLDEMSEATMRSLGEVECSLYSMKCGRLREPSPPSPSTLGKSQDEAEEQESCHRIYILHSQRPEEVYHVMERFQSHLILDIQLLSVDAHKFGRREDVHGREVGEVVDMVLIKRWLEICQTDHGDACERVWWRGVGEELPETVRMIDIETMSIVPAPRGCRFIALSYVWGGIGAEYQTMRENFEDRRRPGGLDSSILPATISDSILFCRELAVTRFLWVDAICMIQDSDEDKRVQIGVMELIYGSALFTIFAVGGHNAHAGLPGLRVGSRKKTQHIEVIQGLHLSVPFPTIRQTLAQSVWGTRGWTYQEVMLSRRRIFFTPQQVYWECVRDVWSEDVVAEGKRSPRSRHPLRYTGAGGFTFSSMPTVWKDEYTAGYTRAVEQYTKRALTNELDAVDAISALTNAIAKGFKLGEPRKAFRYGMVVTDLNHALLWHSPQGEEHRRRDIPKGKPWPSWAWAGWSGGVRYSDPWSTTQTHSGIMHSLVESWYIWTDGRLEKMGVRPIRGIKFLDDSPATKPYILPSGKVELEVENQLEVSSEGTLVFYSATSFLRVEKADEVELENTTDSGYGLYILIPPSASTSAPAGKAWLPSDTPSLSLVQFVVLSRSTGNAKLHDEAAYGPHYSACFLYVMAVREVNERSRGLLERCGIGIVYEQVWMGLGATGTTVRLR